MSLKTAIAWTDHTFNIAWGCEKVSPGCKNCYADTLSSRYGHNVWGKNNPRRTFGAKHWAEPLAWEKLARLPAIGSAQAGPHKVFSSSMCDIFEDHATIARERERLWPLIRQTPNLYWQLLTKRAERIAANLPADWSLQNYPNVWLGVSIENSDYAWRADHLRDIEAAVRFISYEPALGDLNGMDLRGIDWVIFGGESGPGYRAPEGWQTWARELRARCHTAGTAFFFKQSPAHRTELGTQLDGETVRKFPTPRSGHG